MKIVRYKDETGVKLGAVKGDGVIDLTRRFPSLSDNAIELIQQWSEAEARPGEDRFRECAGCSFGKRASARAGSATRQDHGDRSQLRGPHQRDRSKDAASSNLVHQGGDLDQRTV